MASIGYGGKGKKPLVIRITEGDYVSDKELQSSMNRIMQGNATGAGRIAKTLGIKMGLKFVKHI